MKIGIMSMQRVVNYGSFLQAYGLKKEIESLGHQVEFVDYEVEAPVVSNEIIAGKRDVLIQRALRMINPKYRQYRKKQIKMNQTFSEFVEKYKNEFMLELGVTNSFNYRPKLDALVIGSDEVFNCTQAGELVGYSRQLFGKDNNAQFLMSYAASFGSTTLEKLQKYEIFDEVSLLLSEFDVISVRDNNSLKLIQEMRGCIPDKHIDPVLLYEFPEVNDYEIDMREYIVVYAYADRMTAEEIKVIKDFAKVNGKKILTLGFWQPFADEYRLVSPIELLAYIKKAAYVITDTFHGTVFSIKYQRPFATIIRGSNKQKLGDLLQTFNLNNRQVLKAEDIPVILKQPMNVNDTKDILYLEQLKARNYLGKYLSE